MKRLLYVTTLLLVSGALTAWAQTPSTGAQLSGAITDPSGAIVRGATVTLHSNATGLGQTTTTDASGQYRFLLVPAGEYSLSVEAPGFSKLTNTGVILTVGQVANLPITLQVAGATAEISVTIDAGLVETERTSVATTVDQKRIENLPIN